MNIRLNYFRVLNWKFDVRMIPEHKMCLCSIRNHVIMMRAFDINTQYSVISSRQNTLESMHGESDNIVSDSNNGWFYFETI